MYSHGKGHLDYKIHCHQTLPYKREPFNDPESVKKWREMGFSHEHFTGEMYDMKRPCPAWFDQWKMFRNFPGWKHLSWSFYKMTSGVILPRHADLYKRFLELYPNEKGTIGRALVMLEDWKPGHYLDLDDVAYTNWKQGDYFWWTEDCPHTAANIGTENRFTLQLTGFIPDEYIEQNRIQ